MNIKYSFEYSLEFEKCNIDFLIAVFKQLNGKVSSLVERVMKTVNMRVNVGKWTPSGVLNAMKLRLAHYYNDWIPEEPDTKGAKIIRI